MRRINSPIWERWRNPKTVVPLGWVTIEKDWYLNDSEHTFVDEKTPYGASQYVGPFRWWQRADNSQFETILPNVDSITWARSIDSQSATGQVTLGNTRLTPNGEVSGRPKRRFGEAGYLTPTRMSKNPSTNPNGPYIEGAGSLMSEARWGLAQNEWYGQLVPNAMLRTYEGLGNISDPDKTLSEALEDGDVVLTGVWLVGKPKFSHDAKIILPITDMTKALITQQMYPPFMPKSLYPLRYAKTFYDSVINTSTEWVSVPNVVVDNQPDGFFSTPYTVPKKQTLSYSNSSSEVRFGRGKVIAGHKATDVLDGKDDTFWLSEGYQGPNMPYGVVWWEASLSTIRQRLVQEIELNMWGSGYTVYISVGLNGKWYGNQKIPYSGALPGQGSGADINFVKMRKIPSNGSVNNNTRIKIPLGNLPEIPSLYGFPADKVRISFKNLTNSHVSSLPYRAGLRDISVKAVEEYPTYGRPGFFDPASYLNDPGSRYEPRYIRTGTAVPRDGNYDDYSDIVKQLLLWAGWWLPVNDKTKGPDVYGNIESTGAYAEGPLPVDMFDKRPPLDAINQIKDIVGYFFWIGEEGEAHFESPNYFSPGNFDEYGQRLTFMPEFDEAGNLMNYSTELDADYVRSEIIISTEEPTAGLNSTKTSRMDSAAGKELLRGMIAPAMWVNDSFLKIEEQQAMAELIGMHIFMSLRGGSSKIVANPLLSVNDQVRIIEEVNAESSIHYVRSISSNHNFTTGEYTMDVGTNWLGDRDNWALRKDSDGLPKPWRIYQVTEGDTWNIILLHLSGRYPKETFTLEGLQARNEDKLTETGNVLVPGMILEVG